MFATNIPLLEFEKHENITPDYCLMWKQKGLVVSRNFRREGNLVHVFHSDTDPVYCHCGKLAGKPPSYTECPSGVFSILSSVTNVTYPFYVSLCSRECREELKLKLLSHTYVFTSIFDAAFSLHLL